MMMMMMMMMRLGLDLIHMEEMIYDLIIYSKLISFPFYIYLYYVATQLLYHTVHSKINTLSGSTTFEVAI